MALNKVASDSVVMRPLRAEAASGRASPTGARKDFEDLLDIRKPEAPPPARTNRAANRNNEAHPADDRRNARSETRAARNDAERPTAPTENSKPAASTDTKAKDGQPADTSEPVANVTEAGPEDAAQQQLLALAEAAIAVGEGEAEPEAASTEETAPADKTDKASDETDVAATVDVTTIDAMPDTTTPVAAVLPATPEPAKAAPVPTTDGDSAEIAPVGQQATPVAPADASPDTPADTAPEAPVDAAPEKVVAPSGKDESPKTEPAKAVPVKAEPAKTEPVKAEPVKAEPVKAETAPTQEPQKPAPIAATPEALAPKTRADEKPAVDTKAKPDHPGIAKHADAPAPRETTPRAPEAIATNPAKADDPQAAKIAEHIASRHAPAETPNESAPAPTPAAPAPTAASTIGVTPPLHLNLPSSPILPTLSPLTALRVEAPADTVPVAGLAVEIVARAQEGSRRFEIRLDPPELGRIDVRLDVDQSGKVSSRLVVERTETLDFLRRDAHQLERALQNAGLNTEGGLEFSLRDQSFAQRDQSQRDGSNSRLIIPEDEAVAAEAARRGYGRMIGLGGGVDIRV